MALGPNYVNSPRGAVQSLGFVWDVNLLIWTPEVQPIVQVGTINVPGSVDVSDRVGRLLGHIQDDSVSAGVYTTAIEFDANNNPIYIGAAVTGSSKGSGVWLIRKLTYDANNNVTDIQYANGSLNFNQIWNNRGSLSYS